MKLLLVASTGGHLAQLHRLAPRLGASEDSLWVTFRTPQSESLLRDRRVLFVPYVASRDYRGVAQTAGRLARLLATERFQGAVSTGAGVALSALPLAKLRGIPTLYIESVSRVDGPSFTGRVLQFTRTAELRTQHPAWANRRWKPMPSVLNAYGAVVKRQTPVPHPKIFVTLGTIKGFRFDSAIDAVLRSGLASDNTTWQLGETHRRDLPGEVTHQIDATTFDERARNADVVVTHSGVGTVLDLLEKGIYPVVLPRSRQRGEHVDDHQYQIAALLEKRGLATVRESGQLTADDILQTTRYAVTPA